GALLPGVSLAVEGPRLGYDRGHAVRSRDLDHRLSHRRDRDALAHERPREAPRSDDRREAALLPGAPRGPSDGALSRAARPPESADRGDDGAGHPRRALRALLHLSGRLLRLVR